MAGSTRRKFSKEFKESIFRLVAEGQRSVAQVSRDHDLAQSMVYGRVKQLRIDVGQGQPSQLTSQEQADFVQLSRRLKEVEMENFFKKVYQYFTDSSLK